MSEYQCCFCAKKISSGIGGVTALIVVGNWDKDPEMQQEQQLFCHLECLKKSLDVKTPLYILDILEDE